MIIAIDEVGAFEPYSKRYNFMVAALISQRGDGLELKRRQFETWKNQLAAGRFNSYKEIKGTELTESELHDFTLNVILTPPFVRNVQIRIIPNENPEYVVDVYKLVEGDLIGKIRDRYAISGDKDGELFFKRFLNWFNHRNFQHYFKLMLIQYCVSRSVQLSIGASLVDWIEGDDTNLMGMQIKIDGDFIKKSGEKKYFNELLKQSFRRITEIHPVPMVRELIQTEHAFAREYLLGNEQINLGAVFNDRCTFLDSHNNFELQIADVLGTVIHRASNTGTCLNSLRALDDVLGARGQIKQHLTLNSDPDLETKIVFESVDLPNA